MEASSGCCWGRSASTSWATPTARSSSSADSRRPSATRRRPHVLDPRRPHSQDVAGGSAKPVLITSNRLLHGGPGGAAAPSRLSSALAHLRAPTDVEPARVLLQLAAGRAPHRGAPCSPPCQARSGWRRAGSSASACCGHRLAPFLTFSGALLLGGRADRLPAVPRSARVGSGS